MSTPNMEMSNLITTVSAGNQQQAAVTNPGDAENNGFTSLFEGIRNLLLTEETASAVDNPLLKALPAAELPATTATEPVTDDAQALLTSLPQTVAVNGKPLPVGGELLPEQNLSVPEVGVGLPEKAAPLPDGGDVLPEQAASLSRTNEIQDEQALTLPVAPTAVLSTKERPVSEPETDKTPRPFEVAVAEVKTQKTQLQSSLPLSDNKKLSQVKTDSSVAAVNRAVVENSPAYIEKQAVILPVASQLEELTHKGPVKPALESIAVQSVLENKKFGLKSGPPEPVVQQTTNRNEPVTESEAVEDAAGIILRNVEKPLEQQPATAVIRTAVAERLPHIETTAHSLQIDTRVNDVVQTTLRSPLVQSSQEAFVLPETLSLRQPGWDQNLGNNIIWMVKEDLQSASIRVKPAELGPLNIQISMQHEQLQVNISVHNAAAREALEAALPRLREQFVAQGYQQVNVDISQEQERGFAGQQNGSDHTENAAGYNATESNPAQLEHLAGLESQTYPVHDGLLDAFA